MTAADGREEPLLLSGLQHFSYCPRQWALIHVENQWQENVHTVDGDIFHERAHGGQEREKRGDLLITRGLRIFSHRLGLTGQCDVVEFRRVGAGVSLHGEEGSWQPCPVEYKRGKPKEHDADELQLCAQAMCLEEMLACEIPEGSLFYGEPRRRTAVRFTPELRERVETAAGQMREYMRRGYTPRVKPSASCRACSLSELCLPGLGRTEPVSRYMRAAMEEDSP